MPFSFPSSPTVGQQSTQNGRVYAWSGAAWELASQIASHTHAWTDITSGRPTTLSGYGITDAVASSDARLTNSREWSADTISQAEAEAGTETTRRAFTAQRVFQAIAAWWAASSAKTKLDGIATGATANATDAQLRDRSTHTGTQAASTISDFSTAAVSAVTWSTITGKPASFSPSSHKASHATGGTDALTAADIGAVGTSDSRLADSREWSAATVSQADAEAGTSSSRFAYTPLRVFQAIAAWWAASAAKTKLDGISSGATANATDAQLRDRSTHTGTQAISTVSSLQAALDSKAGIATPAFVDNVTVLPTNMTGSASEWSLWIGSDGVDNTSQIRADGTILCKTVTATAGIGTNQINWASIAAWTANTNYTRGDLVSQGGVAYRRISSGSGGATFNAAQWIQITPSTGTGSSDLCIGNDPRLSDARTPTGAAGGDLTGTYPNPQIAAGAVVEADLANNAVTTNKIANAAVTVAKISASGTASASTVLAGDGSWKSSSDIESVHPFLLAGM